MKKLTLLLMTICLLVASTSLLKAASTPENSLAVPATSTEAIEANLLLNRLDEIHGMDMTSLTKIEKKELRQEVRTIKQDLKTTNGGVYLSVGAIIIIILLLILLL